MTIAKRYFRWWYLLLLLPPLLYVGARWYIGHRIDGFIAQANEGDNRLDVTRYSYGLFPLSLRVDEVVFEQQRDGFSTHGRLSHASLIGVQPLSLIGGGTVEIDALQLRGLRGHLEITASSSAPDSSSRGISIGRLTLDSITVEIIDPQTQRSTSLENVALSVSPLHLPLAAQTIEKLSATAETIRYTDTSRALRVESRTLSYDDAHEALSIAVVSIRQEERTDIEVRDLLLTGLGAADASGELSLDTLRIDSLGGVARVPPPSGDSSAGGQTPSVAIGQLILPHLAVGAEGDFGRAGIYGALRVMGIDYGSDGLTVRQGELSADSLLFDDGGDLAVALRKVRLQQDKLRLPLRTHSPGRTLLDVGTARMTKESSGLTASLDSLTYDSASEEVAAVGLYLSSGRTETKVQHATIRGMDRQRLIDEGVVVAADASLNGLHAILSEQDRSRYHIDAPAVRLSGLSSHRDFSIDRTQIANASVIRYGHEGNKMLTARGIYVDQYGLHTPLRPEQLGPAKLRASEIVMFGDRLPIDYRYYALAYDSRAGLLTLDSLNRRTRLNPGELFGQRIAKSWLDFGFDGLRLSGIDHPGLMSGELVAVDSLSAKDFRLTVVEDLSLDLPSREKPMPLEALRELGPRIVLRTARFASTDIAYGIVDSVLQPKTIHFNGGLVRLTGLDTKVSTRDSVRAVVDATFEGTTPVHAEFVLARDSSGRNYAVRGQMQRYDLSGINPLMRVAAEAIVESGIIERMEYRGELKDEVMTGQMRLLYHDLDLKLVGGGSWLKNLLSGLVLKNENQPGEDFRPGRIYHEHLRTNSFFNAYWKGLVSGMKSSALSDIVLKKELE